MAGKNIARVVTQHRIWELKYMLLYVHHRFFYSRNDAISAMSLFSTLRIISEILYVYSEIP